MWKSKKPIPTFPPRRRRRLDVRMKNHGTVVAESMVGGEAKALPLKLINA